MADEDLPEPFGNYLLIKSIGRGGGGEVFVAKPTALNHGLPEVVVVKRLLPELSEEEEFTRRFRHEAELATRIDSPHVAKVYDAGEVDSVLYFAQELIEGMPLSRIMKTMREAQQVGGLEWMIDLISGALLGLHALHTAKDATGAPLGIVHRDIAPKNIMVIDNQIARLIDLGIGRSNISDWETRTGLVLGSPGYMAPEQVLGRVLDHRADLYAIGVILWELSTAQSYIERGPLQRVIKQSIAPKYRPVSMFRSDLPPAIDVVLRRAVAHEPGDRFPSAEAFLSALEAMLPRSHVRKIVTRAELSAEPTMMRSVTMPAIEQASASVPFAPERPRRSLSLIAASVVLGIALLSFGSALYFLRDREREPEPRVIAAVLDASAEPAEVGVELPALDASLAAPAPLDAAIKDASAPARRAAVAPPPVRREDAAVPAKVQPEPEAAAKVVEVPIEDYVQNLIERALRLQNKYPAGEVPPRLSSLVFDLNMLAASPRLRNERALAEEYARTLQSLERAR